MYWPSCSTLKRVVFNNIHKDDNMAESIQKLPVVISRVAMSRSTLLQRVKEGRFPKPIKLSENGHSVGWIESEVTAFIASRIAQRDGGAA